MKKSEPRQAGPAGNILTLPGLASPRLLHGTFNRQGGVSHPPWDFRNVSFGLGDDPANVRANREAIKQALGCSRLISARQVHGKEISAVQQFPEADHEVDGCDGIVTSIPAVGLMIQQADCQAVMLFEPARGVVAIAHAGWRGSVANIIGATVAVMKETFGAEPARLIAGISPSLGPCCAEFVNFRNELPPAFHPYQVRPNHFDFWAISRDQLHAAGVRPKNIHVAGICTRCSPDYFSYRREKVTGRFASVICLNEE
jgi:YfiH family protein